MKKILALILSSLIVLSLSSCFGKGEETKESVNTVQTSASTEVTTEATSQTIQTHAADNYKSLKCTDINDFRKVNFVAGEGYTALNLSFPKLWKLKKSEDGNFLICRGSLEIGSVIIGEDSDGGEVMESAEKTRQKVKYTYTVNKYGEGADVEYFRKLLFEYNDGDTTEKITIKVKYTEIDDGGMDMIKTLAQPVDYACVPEMGTIPFSEGNGNKSILILGNSFIYTSQIGNTLQDLCGDKCKVTGISRANVSVLHYVADEAMLERIASGQYGMLFMCGFFSSKDVEAFEEIQEACEKSDTVLVIFPAHNEVVTSVNSAKSKFSESAHFLDWRTALNNLVLSGVDYWDLCMHDGPEHSTPLAGYVGAYMIYCAVFGEVPENVPTTSITQEYIEEKLGDYHEQGRIWLVDEDSICYFG